MANNVIVYSTPTCPYCMRLKEFLKQNSVSFDDVDVSSDTVRAEEMVKKSQQMGVPVTDIDGDIVVGFDKDALKQKLGV